MHFGTPGRARREEDVERVGEGQRREGRAAAARKARERVEGLGAGRARRDAIGATDIGDDDDRRDGRQAGDDLAELARQGRSPCRRSSSRRRRGRASARSGRSGRGRRAARNRARRRTRSAPIEAVASIAAIVFGQVRQVAPRRGRRRRRRARTPAAGARRGRASSRQDRRRSNPVLAAEDDRLGIVVPPKKVLGEVEPASGKKRAPGIRSPSTSRRSPFFADDTAEVPNEIPETRRGSSTDQACKAS